MRGDWALAIRQRTPHCLVFLQLNGSGDRSDRTRVVGCELLRRAARCDAGPEIAHPNSREARTALRDGQGAGDEELEVAAFGVADEDGVIGGVAGVMEDL